MDERLASVGHWRDWIAFRVFAALVRVPFGFAFSVLVLVVSSSALLLFGVLCLAYRILWLGTAEGRIYRHAREFERRKEKIRRQEVFRRRELSRQSDRKIIGEMISLIRKEMDQRKREIGVDKSVLARIRLQDCVRDLDFDSVMKIYEALTQTESGSINQQLERQLGLHPKV